MRPEHIIKEEINNLYKQVNPEYINNDPLDALRRKVKPHIYKKTDILKYKKYVDNRKSHFHKENISTYLERVAHIHDAPKYEEIQPISKSQVLPKINIKSNVNLDTIYKSNRPKTIKIIEKPVNLVKEEEESLFNQEDEDGALEEY